MFLKNVLWINGLNADQNKCMKNLSDVLEISFGIKGKANMRKTSESEMQVNW
jgi:hypothetical protein